MVIIIPPIQKIKNRIINIFPFPVVAVTVVVDVGVVSEAVLVSEVKEIDLKIE